MNRAEDILEEVGAFREATRTLVRDGTLDVRSKCLALLRLADRADQAGEPAWCRRVVYEEAREFLNVGPIGPDVPGDPVEIAARSLRARGHECCPMCARRLHNEDDFARWRRVRTAWVEEVRAKKGAVRP